MSQSLAHPGKLSTVMRLIVAGGRSNDACLHARRFLEHAVGAPGQRPFTRSDGDTPRTWSTATAMPCSTR